MGTCETCGKEIPDEALHCPSCGTTTKELKAEGIDLYWGMKCPVIGSSIVVKQLTMALGGGMLFVFILLLVVDFSAAIGAAPVLVGIFIFFLVLGLIIAGGIQFFTKGGPYMEFAVTKDGVGYKAGDESTAINLITLAGSVLGGSLSGTGGSLINISREMDFMEWKEIRSVTAYRRDHSILFYRKALVNPFAFYCTPDVFEKVVEIAWKRAPQAKIKVKYM
jgi:hypothetical protein